MFHLCGIYERFKKVKFVIHFIFVKYLHVSAKKLDTLDLLKHIKSSKLEVFIFFNVFITV